MWPQQQHLFKWTASQPCVCVYVRSCVCVCVQTPNLGAASWLISKPSLSICSEPRVVWRQHSPNSLSPSLSHALPLCLSLSLSPSLSSVIAFTPHSPSPLFLVLYSLSVTPSMFDCMHAAGPGSLAFSSLHREMMVNIRETAAIISLMSAFIPMSPRPGALRLVFLSTVLFQSHIAGQERILFNFVFFLPACLKAENFPETPLRRALSVTFFF